MGTDEAASDWTRRLLTSPELTFFLRLTLPCLILYKTPPGPLMRRAREGDLDSLERLIRLDKAVLCDPVIAEHWTKLINDKPSRRRRWANAVAGFPKAPDGQSIRVSIAGLLSQLAKREGCPMTSTEIREFLDMFVPEENQDRLPFGEAMTKAMQRHRNWPIAKGRTDTRT